MTAYRNWPPGQTVAVGDVVEPSSSLFYAFKCTTAGVTGQVEPDFGAVAAVATVVPDNTANWTSVAANVIEWVGVPIYKTGTLEPTWPTTIGSTVSEPLLGNLLWTTEAPVVGDAKCPHTRIAITMAQKVFAAFEEVMRYSATNDPLDWSTQDDAGFLPIGMHAAQDPKITAVGDYRGRMAIWTGSGLQIWTVDPDPLEMAIFDKIDGIGTQYPRAVCSVSNDLIFLTPQGVRSLSVAAGATNLETDDIGSPVDGPIQTLIASGVEPVALYYPGFGQFLITFGADAWAHTAANLGKRGRWSRFQYGGGTIPIHYSTQLGGKLFVRSGNSLYEVDRDVATDAGSFVVGTIKWAYLDFGAPGVTTQVKSVDIVATGVDVRLSIGYDQRTDTAYTSEFVLPLADTVAGARLPICVAAPTMAVKLDFRLGPWTFNYIDFEVEDLGGGP